MSVKRRVAGTLTTVVVLASTSAFIAQEQWQIAGAATQSQPGPLEQRAKLITPENPVPRRVFFVAAQYPPEAAAIGARATVTLRVTVDELGRIGELRLSSAPLLGAWVPNPQGDQQTMPVVFAAFAKAAMDAVRQWQYDPPADGPVAFDVSIGFGPDGEPRVVSHGGSSEAFQRRSPAWHRPRLPPRPPLARLRRGPGAPCALEAPLGHPPR
jgi:hypothetical protein